MGSNFHRINKQFLSRPKKLGSCGLPILENYYLAAQLHFIYTYLASPEMLGWKQIEESYVSPKCVKEIIWHNKVSGLTTVTLNPFLYLTLKIWDRCKTHQPSIAAAFLGQPWFPPASSLQVFRTWRAKGIWRFNDIMIKGKFLTKVQLEQKFEAQISWYEYLQVQSMFARHFLKY